MIAILSATEHDFYAGPLPFVVWAWKQLGIDAHVFIPEDYGPKLSLAMTYCEPDTEFHTFKCEKHKEATYAQVSRLFGAKIPELFTDNATLVTGDADLAPFNVNYFRDMNDGDMHVVGADLLEDSMKQYPMCFLVGDVENWYCAYPLDVEGLTYQQCLDKYVGELESDAESFRGNFWARDQWLAYQWFNNPNRILPIIHHDRAALPNRWASKRADRDGWANFDPNNLIDAHLGRPIMREDNFTNMISLFDTVYPNVDKAWMEAYRQEYLSL